MIRQEEVYRIGVIGKAHGVKGEVVMYFDDDVFDRVDADYLVLDVDGILVPFYIEGYRFRSDTTILLKLDGVDSQQQARELTGCEVYFPHILSDHDNADGMPTWASLVGYSIVDTATKTVVGRVASIDTTTPNTLFCLDTGALIPAASELVAAIDSEARQISMALPQGLLSLYNEGR